LSRLYRVHEFAELAGVTVKALHHYDRLGLLKPGRTDAGYRMYAERDLERLEQIVALKFLGLPLKQIKIVLDRPALALPDALRLQREAIAAKQALLGRAIRAIRAAEEVVERGKAADPAVLKKIIEVIDMQEDIEEMKKYYGTEESWERHRRYYQEGPSPEWRELYRDAGASLNEDPGSEKAQALAARWFELGRRAYYGDPNVQTGSPTAWMDREHWPPAMKQRIAEFNLEAVTEFIKKAALSGPKKYFTEDAWDKLVERREQAEQDFSFSWQARVDLFRDIEAALGEDPSGEKAQALGARWTAQTDRASGGDPGVKAGLMKAWADRRNWTAPLRWQAEALYMMVYERFEKAADFIDKTVSPRDTR
jgi:DNA-binding transcriptional MerR regulator